MCLFGKELPRLNDYHQRISFVNNKTKHEKCTHIHSCATHNTICTEMKPLQVKTSSERKSCQRMEQRWGINEAKIAKIPAKIPSFLPFNFPTFFSRTSNTFSVHFFLAASYSSLNLLFFSCFFPVSNVAFCESVVCIFFWYCGFVWQSRHRKHERERVRKKCRWLPV